MPPDQKAGGTAVKQVSSKKEQVKMTNTCLRMSMYLNVSNFVFCTCESAKHAHILELLESHQAYHTAKPSIMNLKDIPHTCPAHERPNHWRSYCKGPCCHENQTLQNNIYDFAGVWGLFICYICSCLLTSCFHKSNMHMHSTMI